MLKFVCWFTICGCLLFALRGLFRVDVVGVSIVRLGFPFCAVFVSLLWIARRFASG